VQMLYHFDNQLGLRLAAHPLLGAVAFTGSKTGGLALKAAADAAGKPIYLELGSINPVLLLPGALRERGAALAAEFAGSCLMGTGQFCTNAGLALLLPGPATESFLEALALAYRSAPNGPLLSDRGLHGLDRAVERLRVFGAQTTCGGREAAGPGFHYENTLLRVAGRQFLEQSDELQTEAFGNATLAVVAEDPEALERIVERLHGNLTGCIYSATDGSDDALHDRVAPALRERVGRLLNDKMPTGVAVSPAMQHGGPYPASGHAGFTAVGFPATVRRFGALQCWDNVRPQRLPAELRDANLTPPIARFVEGEWTTRDLG
jgi:2,5-dioxopentanoate dehydrogenase